MTTLITGTGLLGRLAARMLRDQGRPVLLADIHPSTDLDGMPVVTADVGDWAQMERIARTHGVREIVHTAAMLTPGMRRDPLAGVRTNVMGTAHVLEVAIRPYRSLTDCRPAIPMVLPLAGRGRPCAVQSERTGADHARREQQQ